MYIYLSAPDMSRGPQYIMWTPLCEITVSSISGFEKEDKKRSLNVALGRFGIDMRNSKLQETLIPRQCLR